MSITRLPNLSSIKSNRKGDPCIYRNVINKDKVTCVDVMLIQQ